MRELFTEITIQAPAGRVWDILVDFPAYPRWNPFVRSIQGEASPGERLVVYLQPSGSRGMGFRPTVLKAERGRELRWLGRVLAPGLFDGEHILQIVPLDDHSVRFIQREQFSGLLVGLLGRMLIVDTRRGFEEMNQALKKRAEGETQ